MPPRSSAGRSVGVDVDVHRQRQGTPLCPGTSRHRLDRGSPKTAPHFPRRLRHWSYGAWRRTSGSWCQETSGRHSCQETRSTATSSSYLQVSPVSMLRLRKGAERLVNAPEEMVGLLEAITSESWISIQRVGCLRLHQKEQGPRRDWISCG